MVGLMQIMIYLFCVYLIYKGAEIFQIAFVSTTSKAIRTVGIIIGVASVAAAIIVSGIAIFMTEALVAKIGENMQNMPKIP